MDSSFYFVQFGQVWFIFWSWEPELCGYSSGGPLCNWFMIFSASPGFFLSRNLQRLTSIGARCFVCSSVSTVSFATDNPFGTVKLCLFRFIIPILTTPLSRVQLALVRHKFRLVSTRFVGSATPVISWSLHSSSG